MINIPISYIFFLFFLFFLVSCTIYFWNWLTKNLPISNDLNSIQAIHSNNTPRLFGLFLFLFFIATNFYYDLDCTFFILCFLPIVTLTFLEDFYTEVFPILRLLVVIISSFLLINYYQYLPKIDILFMSNLFSDFPFIELIFFTACISVSVNGFNFIDGMNGILGFFSICALSTLFIMGFILSDIYLIKKIIYVMPFIILFMLFNYPFGKIFMGDTGAYFLGFYISHLILYIFFQYSYLFSWGAVLLLIYPAFEVLFMIVFRSFKKLSLHKPSNTHLHSIIYDYYFKKFGKPLLANNLVLLTISPLIIFPFLVFIFFYNILDILVISIISFIIVYLLTYLFFLKFLIIKVTK